MQSETVVKFFRGLLAGAWIALTVFTGCRVPAGQAVPPAWAFVPFRKADNVNPVLTPGPGVFKDPVSGSQISWEEKDVFNPAIVVKDGKVYMLYRAQDSAGTSRIGLASSSDGYHFQREPAPVLYPWKDSEMMYEWPGGCEDPRIVEDSLGTYFMTYTAYDGQAARLSIATSPDLRHWTKRGLAFAKAEGGKYANTWTKSGSIVSRYKDGKIIAAKINGVYWMYWGDQFIWAATSDDLVNWTPVEMEHGEHAPVLLKGQALKMPNLRIVVPTRAKKFDSDLVEPGPPAMLTDIGIILIFNGRNVPSIGDSSLPEGTYAGSQALLDANDPLRLIDRLDKPFIQPDKPYEITGQVNRVCFLEGLANFQGKWFLYYGTADSRIAVAVMGK